MTSTAGRELRVELGERSYPIRIQSGGLSDMVERWAKDTRPSAVLVVADKSVTGHFSLAVQGAIDRTGCRSGLLTLPPGEPTKNIIHLQKCWDACFDHKLDRSSAIAALGGGVIGDLAGFAAATYLRGIRLVQIPTTLLAQVDSSVGGKTAINHPESKNSIGAFYQPNAVLIDPATLRSLPEREFKAGLAEVVKYGVIADAKFFDWLAGHTAAILKHDPATIEHLVESCCRIKAEVVGADETETGLRAILNFGHTFAHAIESVAGYGQILHGEAVAVGMALAGNLAATMGLWQPSEQARLLKLMDAFGLNYRFPIPGVALATADLMEAMTRDKKVRNGRLRLILPEGMGQVQLHDAIAVDAVKKTWETGV
ncbi:MAG TPA: 3-dehydroquinate synthase [Planctomycetota bacterium]|nr:3-dehydroquinate synthase [Planctomycetota bacterium]